MNTFSKLFCGIALAGMMFSCSNNDEPNMPGEEIGRASCRERV